MTKKKTESKTETVARLTKTFNALVHLKHLSIYEIWRFIDEILSTAWDASARIQERCAECGGTFLPRHWIIGQGDKRWHRGCAEKTGDMHRLLKRRTR